MKGKKTAQPRRRVSFAVDRDEIDINSDWVRAVMDFPSPLVPAEPAPRVPPAGDLFFALEANNATGVKSTTGAECTPVENAAAVVNNAAVVESAAVADSTTDAEIATVGGSATVADKATDNRPGIAAAADSGDDYAATVAPFATDAVHATGEGFASTKDHRRPRPRPIRRITDGLTPGQYAVYSLMYGAGEPAGADRIYKGGYADLGRLTGLSKRGIQNIIAELQAKQVIRIHQAPGYHRTETSAYLVPGPDQVLANWSTRGWRYALGKSKTLAAGAQ